MKRRFNNEGSIFQRKDGRWVAQISRDGKLITRYAKSQPEALAKLLELRTEAGEEPVLPAAPPPPPVTTSPTLSDWISQWLEINELLLRPSTFRAYHDSIAFVSTILGDTPLNQLTPLNLSRAYVALQKTNHAPRQLNLSHGYLNQCLDYAVSMGLLSSNPMLNVPKPKWTPQRRVYWTPDQTQRFIEVSLVHKAKYSPLFVVLVTTGLRISEAVALTWSDIDLEQQKIKVSRALVWVSGVGYSEMPPKTVAGNRTITMMEATVTALEQVPHGPGLLFQSRKGNPPNPTDLRRRLITLCGLAEVPPINLHGLRHVHAGLALDALKDPYLVQQRLGHGSVAVTFAIYGYPTRDESQVATELDKKFGKGWTTTP